MNLKSLDTLCFKKRVNGSSSFFKLTLKWLTLFVVTWYLVIFILVGRDSADLHLQHIKTEPTLQSSSESESSEMSSFKRRIGSRPTIAYRPFDWGSVYTKSQEKEADDYATPEMAAAKYLLEIATKSLTKMVGSLQSKYKHKLATYDNYCDALNLTTTDCAFHTPKPPPSGTEPIDVEFENENKTVQITSQMHRDLHLIYKWHSDASRVRDKGDIAVVTQMSVDRIDELKEGMCVSWNGPISIAVFVRAPIIVKKAHIWSKSLKEHIKDANDNWQNTLTDLVKKCPQIEALSVLFGGAKEWYPINHLRNVALQQSTAEFVFLIDSDFVPSFHMYETLRTEPYQRFLQQTLNKKKRAAALVIPAFETESSELLRTVASAPLNATEIRSIVKILSDDGEKMWSESKEQFVEDESEDDEKHKEAVSDPFLLRQFHGRCLRCHGPTDYQQWVDAFATANNKHMANASDFENSLSYAIPTKGLADAHIWMTSHGQVGKELRDLKSTIKYEPYVVVRRTRLHRYDPRLVGYGKNKITQIAYLLKCEHYAMRVMNGMFVTTKVHPPSDESVLFKDRKATPLNLYLSFALTNVETEFGQCQDTTGYIQ